MSGTVWYREPNARLFVPDPREEKAPRWVQEKFYSLRAAVEFAEEVARTARLDTKPDESDAVLDYYGDVPVGLGRDVEVFFKPHRQVGVGETWLSVRLVRGDRGVVEVHSSDQLSIRPWSGNAIRLEVIDG